MAQNKLIRASENHSILHLRDRFNQKLHVDDMTISSLM